MASLTLGAIALTEPEAEAASESRASPADASSSTRPSGLSGLVAQHVLLQMLGGSTGAGFERARSTGLLEALWSWWTRDEYAGLRAYTLLVDELLDEALSSHPTPEQPVLEAQLHAVTQQMAGAQLAFGALSRAAAAASAPRVPLTPAASALSLAELSYLLRPSWDIKCAARFVSDDLY